MAVITKATDRVRWWNDWQCRVRLLAGCFVLVALMLPSAANLCGLALNAEKEPGMRPLGTGGLACAEFWFNRYQTLLGGFIALLAAGLAWLGIKRQLFAVGRQIEIADRQNAIAIIPILNERIQYGEKMREYCFKMYDQICNLRTYDKWIRRNIADLYDAIQNHYDPDFAIEAANIHYKWLSKTREDFAKTLADAQTDLIKALADRDLNKCFKGVVSTAERIRIDSEARFRNYDMIFANVENYKSSLLNPENKIDIFKMNDIDSNHEYFMNNFAEINERTDTSLSIRDISYKQAASPVSEK